MTAIKLLADIIILFEYYFHCIMIFIYDIVDAFDGNVYVWIFPVWDETSGYLFDMVEWR